jgi:hypothetical protein
MEDPALPIAMKATRTTQDVEMNFGCADVTSENGDLAISQYGSAYAENVSVNGTDVPVLIVKSPLLINTKINTRTIQLARISLTCSKKATFKVWATRDPSTITGAVFVSINFGSFTETDSPDVASGATRATAVNVTNYSKITAVPVEAAVTRGVDNPLRERITFPIVRGDYLVITCDASTSTADAVVEWGEQI